MLHRDVTTTRREAARGRAARRPSGSRAQSRRVDDYPHQFSGGMRQRVMIAMALINEPDLLIADEPTTALDVTTQAQILRADADLQEEFETAIIMITHDLGVVAEVADDVVVMYAGKVAEEGSVDEIFTRPHHPYTWGLLGSLPRLDADVERLVQIQGSPPSLLNPPRGCRFHPALPLRARRLQHGRAGAAAGLRTRRSTCRRCHLDEETKDSEVQKLLAGHTRGGVLMAAGERSSRRRGPGQALPGHARDRLPEAGGERQGGRRRQLHGQAGRDARRRRRVRLRQVDDGALPDAPARPDERPDHLRRAGHHAPEPDRDAPDPPRADDDLPGSVRVPEPAQAGRLHRRRGAAGAQDRDAGRDQAACPGAARRRRPEPGALQPLPARVLGRTAAADRRRPRARRQPEADRLRRAGLRARRLRAGADPQPAQGPAARLRAHVRLHRARPQRRPAHLRPGRW